MCSYAFEPIAKVHSPFVAGFGTPRQPGLAPAAQGRIEFLPTYTRPEAVRGLDAYSHIWVLFVFDRTLSSNWQPTVRPPRSGGNQRLGVFATRSNFRPNGLGQSVVELQGIDQQDGLLSLSIANFDLLDGTPVLDVKPYLPYADCLPQATSSYAPTPPPRQLQVVFSEAAQQACEHRVAAGLDDPRLLIAQLLSADPRPAYHARTASHTPRRYGMQLDHYNVQFQFIGNKVEVLSIDNVNSPAATINGPF